MTIFGAFKRANGCIRISFGICGALFLWILAGNYTVEYALAAWAVAVMFAVVGARNHRLDEDL